MLSEWQELALSNLSDLYTIRSEWHKEFAVSNLSDLYTMLNEWQELVVLTSIQ